MIAYRTGVTCAFPRTEALIRATRDLDRQRISPADGEAAFRTAEAEVRTAEERIGLEVRTHGYLRWQDPFRPFTTLWEGVSAGPLTRFFETNAFYRQPVFTRPPVGGGGGLASWLPDGPRTRAIVPGPFTFASLSAFEYAPAAGRPPVVEVAEALGAELASVRPEPPAEVEFLEPMLAYAPPNGDGADVVEAYRRLAHALPRSRSLVWTYFGDGSRAMPLLRKLPVAGVGVDLFDTTAPRGAPLGERELGIGCLDARTSLPEDVDGVAARIRELEKAWSPTGVALGPSPPLDLLPFDAAVAKLAVLPHLAEALRR